MSTTTTPPQITPTPVLPSPAPPGSPSEGPSTAQPMTTGAALINLLASLARGVNLPLLIIIGLGVLPFGDQVVDVLWFPPAWKKMSMLIAGGVALAAYAYFRGVCESADEHGRARATAAGAPAAHSGNQTSGPDPQAHRNPLERKGKRDKGSEQRAGNAARASGKIDYGIHPSAAAALRGTGERLWFRMRTSYWFWLVFSLGLIVLYVLLWHWRTLPRPDAGPLSAAAVKTLDHKSDAGYGSDRILLPLWEPRELRATLRAEHGWSNLIDTGGYLVKDLLEDDYRTYVALTTLTFLLLTIAIIFTLTGTMTLAIRSCSASSREEQRQDAVGEIVSNLLSLLRRRR